MNTIACDGGIALGAVRLDNRHEVETWWSGPSAGLSDLALVAHVVLCHRDKFVPRLLGDFAFMVWDQESACVIAARDALGVRTIYYAQPADLLAFSTRAELLATNQDHDRQYLAERVAGCLPSPGVTPYQGVQCVAAGTLVTFRNRTVACREYWSPFNYPTMSSWAQHEREAIEMCRHLLIESVGLRARGPDDVWAHLSGGMDSSTAVSVVQWLAEQGRLPRGLAGTITYVDHRGIAGDERRYASAVSARWELQNRTIDSSAFEDGKRMVPPLTDEPYTSSTALGQEIRLCRLMRDVGGRTLMTGAGGDMLFGGTMFFFADWIVQGNAWAAIREMLRRASIGRVSFWELAYRNALLPLLPNAIRAYLAKEEGAVPDWIDAKTAKRYHLHQRLLAPLLYGGRPGLKYGDAIASGISQVPPNMASGLAEEALDVRHPFYYRPLVEFALQLPAELCVRPYARKWILREAMAGIVPDRVRTRIGKGSYDAGVLTSVSADKAALEKMLRNSVLADLGIVNPERLRRALNSAESKVERFWLSGAVDTALTVEAWLQARSGQAPAGNRNW